MDKFLAISSRCDQMEAKLMDTLEAMSENAFQHLLTQMSGYMKSESGSLRFITVLADYALAKLIVKGGDRWRTT